MENNLGPNASLPTKKGLDAIRRRNAAAAAAAKKPAKALPPLSKLTGAGTTKAAATVKRLIGPVSPLAAGELPPSVASATVTHDDPFADAPVNHVAKHLADPYSRFGSQLRYLRRHLARYRTSRPLLDAIDGIHRGEKLHSNVQRLQSALAVLRKGKVSDSHLSEHIRAMHDGYNWDTLAGNLDADARLSSHLKNGGKAADVSHLYANDAEFQRAMARRKDYEDDKQFLAGTGKHTSENEVVDDIGEVTRKTESPASYLRYVEETWGDRKHHARLSRVGDPELRELHQLRSLAPDPIVADKIQDNGWEHDEHTLDLLRGEHPIPLGHHLHVARHPGTQKIVAWTDEVPTHLQTPDELRRHGGYLGLRMQAVYHGPGGLYSVDSRPSGREGHFVSALGHDGSFLGYEEDAGGSILWPDTQDAHSRAAALAFPHERPVVRMSMVSRVAKAVGMAGGAYLGHALGGHVGDFAGGIAGSLGASSTPTAGWPMVGAAAGGMIGHALHPYITPLLTRLKNLIVRRKQTSGPALSAKTAALLVQAESMVKDKESSASDATQPDRMDQTHRESFRGAMKYLGYPEGEDRRNPEALEAWRLNAHPEVHAAATAAKSATDLESKRHMFRHFLGVVRKHVGLLQHHGYLPLPPERPKQEEPLVGVQSREGRVNELLKYLRGPQPQLLHTEGNPKLGPDAELPKAGAMKRIATRAAEGKGKLPKRRKAKDHFQEFK